MPALRDSEYVRFLNALESFTPDTSFRLGETAEVIGLFVAAGFNSQGIIYAPGAGRALAEWIVAGAPTMDVSSVDVQRFARQQSNRRYLHARTRESLGNLYAMHWPHLQPRTARDVRRTPLHDRVERAGAVFGETAGYERANWYAAPGQDRAYAYSYGRQNWFERAAEEHRAAREAVALFDLSAFTKVEVAGPDALDVVQSVATRNLDVRVNRVVYTLMLNSHGGIALDATVTRLADDRFLVVAPTAAHTKTLGLLRRAASGRAAATFDASAALATIAVMGPHSRELLARVTDADLSTAGLPWGRACEVEIGNGHALCLRVSFVGELGHDIGPADDPYQASLAFTVDLDKPGGFTGRDAIAGRASGTPDRRQVVVRLDDPDPLLLHDESVLRDGEIVGQVTSGAYGHTVGAACGLAYIHGEAPAGAGTRVPATVSDTPFYDPANARLRA